MENIVPIKFTKHYVSDNQRYVTVTVLENGYYGVAICSENVEFDSSIGSSLSFHRAEEQDYNSGNINNMDQFSDDELYNYIEEQIKDCFVSKDFLLFLS